MRVYLSSTLTDLGPERQAVKEALGGECIVVESYSADERSVRESCLDDVSGCDLYICILGRRYGFMPPGQTRSITHLEYEAAKGLPRLVFVKEDAAIPLTFTDHHTKENPPELVDAFRQHASSGDDAASRPRFFNAPEELKFHVLQAYMKRSGSNAPPKPNLIAGRPYPGLRAFRTAEADRFFGRDVETDALIERLLGKQERFLALIGASGSGKSSLVYAGLIPKLTASAVVIGGRWFPVTFSPRELGDDPFQSLAAALVKAFPDRSWRVPDLNASLRENPESIAGAAKDAMGNDNAPAQLLLFVDQFEEIFAGKVDIAARSAFFQLLAAAAACPLLRIVIAMRSDFYTQWPQDEAFIALLRAGHFPVGVPGVRELGDMIEKPARAKGLRIAPRLVQRILMDTGTEPGALALAEFAMARLYDEREGDALTELAYARIGGVAGAIDDLAEQALQEAGANVNAEAVSQLFLAIASVEERGQELTVVRRRVAKSDLSPAALALAQKLDEKRLLVSSSGTDDEGAAYEVGHEALFSKWERFKDWYARYAGDLALRRQAELAAADWEKSGRLRTLQWGWERQNPVLVALRRLRQLDSPTPHPEFTDPGIATWYGLDALPPKDFQEPLRSFLHPEPLAMLKELGSDDTPHHRREEIGLRLNHLGDPRRGVGLDAAGLPDILWIDVRQGGEVMLETDAKDQFSVKPFKMARYPVTWSQYRAFLDAIDGYCDPEWWEGRPREDEPGHLLWSFGNYPAVNVSWYDALAYCRWLSARSGFAIRLPTEWEWQWAAAHKIQKESNTTGGPTEWVRRPVAAGQAADEYPWAGAWNAACANTREAGIGRTVAVGLYPRGQSPFRLDDLAGNVWQWCLNEYRKPTKISVKGEASRVLRGGSWRGDPGFARAADRLGDGPGGRGGDIGFRLCCGSPIE